MTQALIDNLPLIATAPNGIKALRSLILDLAVRGKLVPQDPEDEPASELLKRIAAEKARLEKQGEIKKQAQLPEVGSDAPFRVQNGWTWTRLGAITSYIQRGKSPKYALANGLPVVSQKCVQWRGLELSYAKMIVPESLAGYEPHRYLREGDLLWNSTGTGTIGRVIRISNPPDSLVCDSHVTVVRCLMVDSDYARIWLASTYVYSQIEDRASGTTNQIELTAQMAINQIVPLPPLAEQRRIVAKVDELMALCDRLEAQQADAEAVHATLVKTLLETLTQSQDADDFAANWHRLSQHFPTIFTTEASVDALKQTVVELAVMGKLVPANPNAEPAHELLKRANAEKHRLIKEGLVKAERESRRLTNEALPFKLPQHWEWVQLPEIGELSRGKSKHRPRNDPALYQNGIYPLIQTGDVARAQAIITTHASCYNELGLAQSRLWKKGTLCITIAANIADAAVLGFDACFPDSVVGFVPYIDDIDVMFYLAFLRTAKSNLEKYAPSTAQKNINLDILGSLRVPLPPAEEMRRIVAKVDELLALCDTLKAQIAESRKVQRQLATALVEQTLAA